MSDRPYRSSGAADDGWGPATSVQAGEGRRTSTRTDERPQQRAAGRSRTDRPDDGWAPAGPLSAPDQRATRRAERDAERARAERQARQDSAELRMPRAPERGLVWWVALAILIVIALIGVLIDSIGSIQIRSGFNIGIVVASVIAILAVKRSHMFPIVIAPPIVYSLVAMGQLYSSSGGLHDKKKVFDAAANYLVYGFPAIAAATAVVLIVAGIRLITRK